MRATKDFITMLLGFEPRSKLHQQAPQLRKRFQRLLLSSRYTAAAEKGSFIANARDQA
jgi:hypothetical protein